MEQSYVERKTENIVYSLLAVMYKEKYTEDLIFLTNNFIEKNKN